MNKITVRSRAILYLALILSGLVILSACIYFFADRQENGVTPQMTGVLIGITAVAILAFCFIYYMRVKRNRYTQQLNPAYFAAYEHIQDMMQGSPLGMMERREVLNDVVSLLLQAQQDGRPVSDVVGADPAAFMDRVQQSFGRRSRLLTHILNGIQYSTTYLFLLQLVLFFEEGGQTSFFDGRPDISIVAFLFAISFVAMPLIRHSIRRQNILLTVLIPLGTLVLFIAVMELSWAFLYDIPWVRTLQDGQMSVISSWGMLIFFVALAAAAQGAKWIERRISIRRLM